jgi:hypothetical protein
MTDAREPFSAMDLLVAGVAALTSAALRAAPVVVAPSIAAMYRDFATELPLATELALAWWPSPLCGLGLAALTVQALRRLDVLHRRVLLAASALGGFLLLGALWYALYLPLHQLAGAISAE